MKYLIIIVILLFVGFTPHVSYAECTSGAYTQQLLNVLDEVLNKPVPVSLKEKNEYYFELLTIREQYSDPRECPKEEELRVAFVNYVSVLGDFAIYEIYIQVFPDEDVSTLDQQLNFNLDTRIDNLLKVLD